MSEAILVERDGAIATVVLNRPERQNALNRGMIGELHAALDLAEADPDIRLLALSGEGEAFCSGMDFVEASSDGGDASALKPTRWKTSLPMSIPITLAATESSLILDVMVLLLLGSAALKANTAGEAVGTFH